MGGGVQVWSAALEQPPDLGLDVEGLLAGRDAAGVLGGDDVANLGLQPRVGAGGQGVEPRHLGVDVQRIQAAGRPRSLRASSRPRRSASRSACVSSGAPWSAGGWSNVQCPEPT